MSARRVAGWVALGIAGVLLAVVLTMAATELTSQRVGLQAEPLNAGSELAPDRARPPRERTRNPGGSVPERSDEQEPADAPVPTPLPTFEDDDDNSGSSDDSVEIDDDSSGRGRGRGRGRGGDDDD